MLTIAFVIGILVLIGKVGWIAVKATWGLLKVLLFVLFLPGILVVLVLVGLIRLALPLLVIGLLAAFLLPLIKEN